MCVTKEEKWVHLAALNFKKKKNNFSVVVYYKQHQKIIGILEKNI